MENKIIKQDREPQSLRKHYDSIIVGAGYTGFHAAIGLAREGRSVLIIDKRKLGSGASGKNAGMLLPGVKAPIKDCLSTYGLNFTRDIWFWSHDAIDYVENFTKTENIHCDFSHTGSIELAFKEKHIKNLMDKKNFLLNKFSYNKIRFLNKDDLSKEIDTEAYHSGLLYEKSASLDPARYLEGLYNISLELGIDILENQSVDKINQEKNIVFIRTKDFYFSTQKLLLATNGYSLWRFPKLRSNILPLASYIVVSDFLPKLIQKKLNPQNRLFFDTKKLLNYFRLTPDKRLLFGGRNVLSRKNDHHQSAKSLKEEIIRIFPDLKNIKLSHSWSGHLAVTYNLLPHLHSSGNIYYAYGYCGHGVSLASYLGKESADLMLGKTIHPLHEKIKRKPFFIPYADKIILPILSRYYNFIDRIF